MLQAIPRRVALSLERFRNDYQCSRTPVVLEASASDWPALRKWTPQYLSERFGDVVVPVREYEGESYSKTSMTLGDYFRIRESDRGKKLYLAEWKFEKSCPELVRDIWPLKYFSPDLIENLPKNLRFDRKWMFIGHEFVHTPVHTDSLGTCAWLTMVWGRKTIRMVAPKFATAVADEADLFSDRFIEKAARKGIPVFDTTITAGDTLFIPGKWFHHVRNDSFNLMVTANFVDDMHAIDFVNEMSSRLSAPLRHLELLRAEVLDRARGAGRNLESVFTCSDIAREREWISLQKEKVRSAESLLEKLQMTAPGVQA